ncbi:MAG: DUF6873 family GME fold protein [Candidatus Omnitrophota bacterium]
MLLIHSAQIPGKYLSGIETLFPGLERIPFPGTQDVYPSIRSHPDIFFCQLKNDTLVHSPRVDMSLLSDLRKRGIRLLASSSSPFGHYPNTASLNAARVGRLLLHRQDITDPKLKEVSREEGLTLVGCAQGYTRCSVVPVKEEALITSDMGIEYAANEAGIGTLLVSPCNVILPGEACGFIGGATGILPEGDVLFLGDIRLHPDFKAIEAFLSRYDVGYLYLAGLPLYDAGSLIFIS